MKHIYLAGYSGKTPEALKRVAERLDAVVVDVRISPLSRVPHWNGVALRELLGKYGYWHLPEFGNRNYKNGGRIAIANIDLGTEKLLNHQHDAFLLLCACIDPFVCHRSTVGQHLALMYGLQVREVTKMEWALASEVAVTGDKVGDQLALF